MLSGLISRLFDSKVDKRNKAVASISRSLREQILASQTGLLTESARELEDRHGKLQHEIRAYFDLLVAGARALGDELAKATLVLAEARDKLNVAFAARIVQFAERHGESDPSEVQPFHVGRVDRELGRHMNIMLDRPLQLKRTEAELAAVLQERLQILPADS
jgi:hypothetical protein